MKQSNIYQIKTLYDDSDYNKKERIESIKGIEKFYGLEQLGLSNNNISDISRLLNLVYLRDLDLSNNNIRDLSNGDISSLTFLTRLEKLDLSNNNISNISGLTYLIKLEELDLRYNNINDISPLYELENFSQFVFSNQNITIESEKTEIPIPQILKAAKEEGNIVYANDLVLENCEILEDRIKIYSLLATIKINEGKALRHNNYNKKNRCSRTRSNNRI